MMKRIVALILASVALVATGSAISVENVSSQRPNAQCNTALEYVNYYIPNGQSSITRYPSDAVYTNSPLFPSNANSSVQLWRNGVIGECTDWQRISNYIPGDNLDYIAIGFVGNTLGCTFSKAPNRASDPDRIDAQIHYTVGYYWEGGNGSVTAPWSYKRFNSDPFTCYPSGNTQTNANNCASTTLTYDTTLRTHTGECLNYRVYHCGDGVVNGYNGSTSYNNGTFSEQCDDGNNIDGDGCSATCTVEQTQDFDLALRKTVASSGPFAPGDTITYNITVFNQGDVAATNIQITDYIPAGLTLADSAWTQSGNSATRLIPSLAPGASLNTTITFTINANASGTIRNAAEISAATGGTDCDSTPDNTDGNGSGEGTGLIDDDIGTGCDQGGDEDDHDVANIIVTPVEDVFDLALRKIVVPSLDAPQGAVYVPGDDITYRITLYNQGTIDATNITITDYIPAGLTLNDTARTQVGSTATLIVPSLAAGSSFSTTITFTINANASGTIRNAAEISAATGGTDCDSTPDNTDGNQSGETPRTGLVDNDIGTGCDQGGDEDDHDIAVIDLTGEVDLAINKDVNATQVVDGQTVTFTINFTNEGDVTADYVDIIDTLPRGYDLQSVTLTSFTGSPTNPTHTTSNGVNGATIIRYDDLELDPGEGGTIRIIATVDDNYCPDLTNTVRIELSSESSLHESNLDNNVDTAVTFCESELTLDKEQRGGSSNSYTDNHITVEPGDMIRYRIVVGHSGAESDELSLVDELPDEVSYEGNLDFTVAGSNEDNLCDYDSGDHEIVCEFFSLDADEEAVLEFDVEVESGVDENDDIVNEVTLYEDDRYVDDDSVTASPEEGDIDGEITKEADESDLEVGDRVDFDIEFENTGDIDLVEYTITDIWPGEYLALVCDDELYAEEENDDESDLEDCLEEELEVEHSDHGELDNDEIGFSVDMSSNGDIEITLSFDEDDDDEHLLEPGDSVSFTLEGEALREKDNVTNQVEVDFIGANGDDGDDSDEDDVDIEGGYGQCVEIEAGSLYYDSDQEAYEVEYTCVADDDVEEIRLDCGNGQEFEDEDVDSLTKVCVYDEAGTYDVACYFNDERVASPACTDYRIIKMPENPTAPICGNGVREYYEQCDDGNNISGDGCSATCKNESVVPYCTQYPNAEQCQTFCQRYPNHPDCNPTTAGQLPSCLLIDSSESVDGKTLPMSIMTDESLPFRWAVDDAQTKYVSSCSSASDVNGIVKDSMECSFEIYAPDGSVRSVPGTDCYNMDASELFNGSFTSLFIFGQDGGSLISMSSIINPNLLGEYKIKLSKFTYDVCKESGESYDFVSQSTEECCMVNFTVTKPYLMQQGLGTAKDYNIDFYSNINPLEIYKRLDGSSFAQAGMTYTVIDPSDYDGGVAVDNAIDSFVEKYEALAIGSSSNGYSKVPGKNILVYKGDGTIAASDISGMKSFTVIVDSADAIVELSEDATKTNAMYVIREGTLKIAKAAEEVNGIFVLGSDANLTSEKVRNTDSDFDWNTNGSLTINGVIVGGDDSVRELMESRRSVLRGWFYAQTIAEKEAIFNEGASLYIKNNPSLWLAPPPGVDELDSVFQVYKN